MVAPSAAKPGLDMRAYARVFMLVFLLFSSALTGDLIMAALFSALAAHFLVRSVPWAIHRFFSAVTA